MKFLYAAYAITWLIHIGYLATVAERYKRLRREVEELEKK